MEFAYDDLIGVPFVDGGRDAKSGLDCWGLVKEVFRRQGYEVPDYHISAIEAADIAGVDASRQTARGLPRTVAADAGALGEPCRHLHRQRQIPACLPADGCLHRPPAALAVARCWVLHTERRMALIQLVSIANPFEPTRREIQDLYYTGGKVTAYTDIEGRDIYIDGNLGEPPEETCTARVWCCDVSRR